MLPSLELVRASNLVEDFLPGFEAEVVGVVEAETAAGGFELFVGEAFERGLGCDGHEDGELDEAVGEEEVGGAGFGGLGSGLA